MWHEQIASDYLQAVIVYCMLAKSITRHRTANNNSYRIQNITDRGSCFSSGS